MSRQLNPSQIWSQVPVANRLVEVNTKTGFSLTAGSYSVRASSSQSGSGSITSTNATGSISISSVTVARASLFYSGQNRNNTGSTGSVNSYISATTTVSLVRTIGDANGNYDVDNLRVNIMELF